MRIFASISLALALCGTPCLAQSEDPPVAPPAPIEAGDGLQLRFFQLNYRPALATVELVKTVLSPRGSVLPETRLNKLVVKDTREALARVEKLLEQSDLPSPIVRIDLACNSQLPTSGHQIGVGVNPRGRVVGSLQTSQGTSNATSNQYLMVMSGEKGHISIGEQIPYVQPYWNYVNGLGLLPPGVVFQTVSTGFAVEPTVMGENIKLRIIPFISYLSPNGPGQIEIIDAASVVMLRRGETITLTSSQSGSQIQQQAFGLILGSSGQSRSQSVDIQLSADVMEN